MFDNIVCMEVRQIPNHEDTNLVLSADAFLWDAYTDIAVIKNLCLDRYCQPLEDDRYYTQLKSLLALNQLPVDAIACFIGTDKEFYLELDNASFIPNKLDYKNLQNKLHLLGYDVVLHGFQSYAVYVNTTSTNTNEYGLIPNVDEANQILDQATTAKGPDYKWHIVALWTDETSYKKLGSLLKQ